MNDNIRDHADPVIAVICGGPSAEAEVSRVSAAGVSEALKASFKQVHTVELDDQLAHLLLELNPDVVFPVLHGPPGEDGTVQGFLEILGLPYVGSDVHASANAMDKVISKQIFRRAGLPVIDDVVLLKSDGVIEGVQRITGNLGDYVVVKPARQGSALGVHIIDSSNQLHEALEDAFQFDRQVLAEQRVDGKEITCGVLERNGRVEAFPVIEVVTPVNSWYDYEHRYTKGFSEHIMPAELPEEQTRRIQQIAIGAHQSLGCRDLSRADFIISSDTEEYLLEVNNLPGMTPTSLYPDGARGIGLSFEELVVVLVGNALKRGEP
jgi:D-alanine-D-alanine ligase